MKFKVGDRVRVKPEYDEVARVLGPFGHPGTRPGEIVDISYGSEFGEEYYLVAEDESTTAPYKEHELEYE